MMPVHMVNYFYYDRDTLRAGQTLSGLIPLMDADLRAGFPCQVSIPGHTIVADGLMVSSGVTTYHFNYGWGGENNGWWRADNVAGDSAQYGVTGIRPRLVAFPAADVVKGETGKSVALEWLLPKRLENDVARLALLRQDPGSGEWYYFAEADTLSSRRYSLVRSTWDNADGFSQFVKTSTSSSLTWAIDSSMGGNCFYKKDGGSGAYFLTSRGTVPVKTNTKLYIRCKYLIAGTLGIQVSTDGANFAQVDTLTGWLDPENSDASTWPVLTYDLGAYAGQSLYLRFAYVAGNEYYTEGGFWIDEIGTQEEINPELKGQPVYFATLPDLKKGSYTLAAALTDKSGVDHGMGPSFTLVVSDPIPEGDSDGDGWDDALEIRLGTDPADPNDHLRVWLQNDGGNMIIHYSPHSDQCVFTVEFSDDLSVWRTLEGPSFSGDLSEQMAVLPRPENGMIFYRIRVTAK
jgi:hypothetical protein